tara:strand:+ start:1819 stop:2106 length:288 start_codon:yes stop_codon:yes gene_type:complete
VIIPLNKYLVVEPVKEEKQENKNVVLLPEGVDIKTSPFSLVRLQTPHSESELCTGTILVVQDHMLEKVEITGKTYYLLLENYVVGCLGEAGVNKR